MKRVKLMLVVLTIMISTLMFSSIVYGEGSTGTVNISSITVKETGHVIAYLSAPHNNPDGCASNDSIIILKASEGFKEKFSSLLAAHLAGKSVGFWVSNCYSQYGTTYPIATATVIYD